MINLKKTLIKLIYILLYALMEKCGFLFAIHIICGIDKLIRLSMEHENWFVIKMKKNQLNQKEPLKEIRNFHIVYDWD